MPWKPGQSGNPKGVPRKPEIELFRKALAAVEKTKDKTLLYHAVERAFVDDNVLIALLKKMLPDKIESGNEVLEKLVAEIVSYKKQ